MSKLACVNKRDEGLEKNCPWPESSQSPSSFCLSLQSPPSECHNGGSFRRVCLTCDSTEMFTGCALIDLVENASDATRARHSARFTPAEWPSCRQQQVPIFMMISFVCCALYHLSALHTSRSTLLRFPSCRLHLALHEFISESHSVSCWNYVHCGKGSKFWL